LVCTRSWDAYKWASENLLTLKLPLKTEEGSSISDAGDGNNIYDNA
jgi:hypothetical protein